MARLELLKRAFFLHIFAEIEDILLNMLNAKGPIINIIVSIILFVKCQTMTIIVNCVHLMTKMCKFYVEIYLPLGYYMYTKVNKCP